MNVPSIETLPWEAGRAQEVKAWVCHVGAAHQGVVELQNVIALREEVGFNDERNLTVWGVQDTPLCRYPLEEVWGAWIQWPFKKFPAGAGPSQVGPKYLLNFGFKQYEWVQNGSIRKRYDPSPPTHSIWCDDSNTDGPIMTGSRLRWDDYNADVNGWLRADRVDWQKRVENSHYPSMP